jgi:hypothetical protein
MNQLKSALVVLSLASSSLLTAGCALPSEEQIATGAAASAIQSSRNSAHIQINADMKVEPNACATPEGVAKSFAAQPNVGLYPSHCARKVADGALVHITYDDCTGAFGETHLNGGVDATFSAGDACDDVKATVKDTGNLTGNGRPIEYSANADIIIQGNQRDIAYASEWTADTWVGAATGQDDLKVVQDVSTYCLNVAGHSKATVAGYDFESEMKGIEVCPNACPKAGTLEIDAKSGFNDAKITITFDGTTTAHAVGGKGRKFDIQLVCAGE